MAKNNDSKEQLSGASTLQMMQHQDTAKEFVFHQLPTSVYLSRRFAKKVLLIGISHICRERLKFSKEEFILRTAGDTKVLALNPYEEGENEQTNYVKNHIRQIFQLAENGWLDKVILAIGRETPATKNPLEIYAFNLHEKKICLKIDENETIDLSENEEDKLRMDLEQFLDGLHKKVPKNRLGDVTFSIQVVLNNRAPSEFELDGFEKAKTPIINNARCLFKRECENKFHKICAMGAQDAKREDGEEPWF